MSTIQTLPETSTTPIIETHHDFLLSRVRRNKFTKALVAEVEAFRPKIDAAKAEERELQMAELEASAAVIFADQDLDESVDLVADNVDRKSLLGMRLFGDLRPSELKRPLLGGELAIVKTWPEALAEADKKILKDYAPVMQERVDVALAAEDEKKAATSKLANFRAVGTRPKLCEEFNAFRKSIFGKLGEIQHANKLPSGWAESFFLKDTSEDLTVADLDRKIGAAKANVEALEKQRQALKDQEAKIEAAKAKALLREKTAKLEALQKAKAALEAKEKALLLELAGTLPEEPEGEGAAVKKE
jgi:hypothetical protein